MPDGVKAKNWEDRMQKTERARAIRKLQDELKDEKQSEIQRRRQITKDRKQAAAEKKSIQDEKAKVRDSF
jgi:rRNA-processing protein CGR1